MPFCQFHKQTPSMGSSHSTKENSQTPMTESKSSKTSPSPIAVAPTKKATQQPPVARWKRGVGIFDFILRICAIAASLAAATAMGTTSQQLPFFTQFFQFKADYDDLPAFT